MGPRDAGTVPGDVVPLPPRGEWLPDARTGLGIGGDRDGDRALRVSWHPEHGCTVLSVWHDGRCTGTARLTPQDTARLIGLLARGLADPPTESWAPATGS